MSQGQGFPNRNLFKIKETTVNPAVPTSTQTLVVTGTATGLTVPQDTYKAVIQNIGHDVRFWENGIPTSTSGFVLSDKDIIVIEGTALQTFKVILSSGSTTSVLQIQYYTKP
jgi:hypothetical protein